MSPSSFPRDELQALTQEMRAYLEALQTWGVQHVPGDVPATPNPIVTPAQPIAPEAQGAIESPPASATNAQGWQERAFPAGDIAAQLPPLSLPQLEGLAMQCTQCNLHRGRTHVVFGVGNPQADLMFVGEAPGRDEDLQGEPFVGRAGQLLTRIIEAIGLTRRDVYIANVIKCHPPNNRNPQEEEIARCEPYLVGQIELIKPKLIVALGTFAAQTLLKTNLPISQLRGRFHDYHGVRVMPTFHPAFLLRNPERKRAVWDDMQAVQRELRRQPP
jgi:uracil-DNA glycosylase